MNALTSFAPLRALAWTPTLTPEPQASDLLADTINRWLDADRLWRPGVILTIARDGPKHTVRVFLPEHQQSDRTIGGAEARKVKASVITALQVNGLLVKYADAFWCELGAKGWDVVIRAREV